MCGSEPIALALSRKANRPVKMVMSARRSVPGHRPDILDLDRRQDRRQEGRHHRRRRGHAALPGRRLSGSLGRARRHDRLRLLRPRERPHRSAIDVVVNRPKIAAYRAPSAPMAAFAVESVIDELAAQARHRPDRPAHQERGQGRHRAVLRPDLWPDRHRRRRWRRPRAIRTMTAPLGKNQGRGMACGFWFNFGGQTCTSLNINADGTVTLAVGTTDIGGSRASHVPDGGRGTRHSLREACAASSPTPSSLGYNDITDGSRVTFSSGMATIIAARDAMQEAVRARRQDMGHSRGRGRLGGRHAQARRSPMPATSRHCRSRRSPPPPATPAGRSPATTSSIADGAGVSFATHIVRRRGRPRDRRDQGRCATP